MYSNEEARALIAECFKPSNGSSLFTWMLENSEFFLAPESAGRNRWGWWCPKCAAMGLIDSKRRTPTARVASETWRGVRKEQARREKRHLSHPERVGADAKKEAKQRVIH